MVCIWASFFFSASLQALQAEGIETYGRLDGEGRPIAVDLRVGPTSMQETPTPTTTFYEKIKKKEGNGRKKKLRVHPHAPIICVLMQCDCDTHFNIGDVNYLCVHHTARATVSTTAPYYDYDYCYDA